ncbi:MAG: hypothetical protein ABEI76_02585 [Halobacteriales archaeon]
MSSQSRSSNDEFRTERAGHLFFLMKDELAVNEALEQGATHISETEFVPGI